jgi:hypothetical protein
MLAARSPRISAYPPEGLLATNYAICCVGERSRLIAGSTGSALHAVPAAMKFGRTRIKDGERLCNARRSNGAGNAPGQHLLDRICATSAPC